MVTKIILKKEQKQKQEEDETYFNTYETTSIDKIVINGYTMTSKRKQVFERYGAPEIVIDGEDLMEKERQFRSTGLLSTRVLGLPPPVIVDGIPVNPYFFPQLQDIMTNEINSFEVLETTKNFPNWYTTVYPSDE